MSRNLGRTDCYYCQDDVVLVEAPRAVVEREVGAPYWDEYRGMTVANAECPSCLAQYLAWVTPAPAWTHRDRGDLSFRHSFNDEPDERDLPRYEVELQRVRTGPFKGDRGLSAYLRLGKVPKR
jgi:hypothetical protein